MDLRAAMHEAIELARPAMPHPNPRVGAVVLDASGTVVGRGFHAGPGRPHAEVLALAMAGPSARGSTVVVTLEPCHHRGRTPPCTGALLQAGVVRVVIGMEDPDPRVSGAGIAALREAGVEVVVGTESEAAEALDPGYFHHRRTGRPLVTLKLATTLDGQAAAADGTSMWITSTEARRDVHLMRSRSDAVMVGAGTVLSDDPRLDVRLDGYVGRHPRPVVIAGSRPIPAGAAVLERDPVVLAPGPDAAPRGSVALPGPGGVDLPAGLEYLGRMGVVDLLVEGGPALAGSLLRGGLVDRLVFYLAGRLGGGAGIPVFSGGFGTLDDAVGLSILDVRRIGPDLKVVAVPNEHPGSGSVGDREDPA